METVKDLRLLGDTEGEECTGNRRLRVGQSGCRYTTSALSKPIWSHQGHGSGPPGTRLRDQCVNAWVTAGGRVASLCRPNSAFKIKVLKCSWDCMLPQSAMGFLNGRVETVGMRSGCRPSCLPSHTDEAT